jgi:hypothetical protein
VAENTSSIGTINTKITDQQNQISDTRNQITATNGKLNDQQNQIAATNNSLNSQIGGLQGQINTESSISRAAELSLRNNVAANTASIASNTNEMALKADIDNPKFTGIVAMGTSNPSTSAVLDINSTSQGMLIPRMTTTHRNSIPSPANALLIFNTSNNTFEVYKSSCACWVSLSDGGGNANTNLINTAPIVSTINYKGVYRAGGTANVVYTYSDGENDAEAATTILWEIANDNNGTAKTTYSTSASPTFGEAAAGKFVRVKITPRAATGVLNGIDYYGGWTLIDAATVPYGTAVSISGNAVQGSLLTASYTFNGGSGTENALGSTYTWQSATSNKGANTQTMSIPDGGATFGKTIRPANNEVNKYIRFGVRAKDNASVTASSFVFSDWIGRVTLAAEVAPLATNVSYSPAPGTNVELKASYTYVDANNDPEGTSLYQWYTASDANGANKAPISNATTLNFTPTSAQANKYIGIGVTPKASTGTTTGTEVVYYSTTPSVDVATFTIESVTQSSTNFYINRVMDATDYITVRINVTTAGAITFSTPTINGYSFSNGGVYATGAQNVILNAKGTQAAYNAAGDIFTITAIGSSTQTRTITISNTNNITPLANNVPTANNLNYTGLFRVNGTVNLNYTYADAEKDVEGATTVSWDIATNSNGIPRTTFNTGASTINGTSISFAASDAGKYVRARVTPRAATGLLNGVEYYGGWNLIDLATLPYGSNVSLTGNTSQGSVLTGAYTFNGGSGIENTLGSTYIWQSANTDKGVNIQTMVIPDGGLAFGKTIKPTIAEVNKYIRFGVKALDNNSKSSSSYVYSNWTGPITLAPEAAPAITRITYSQAPSNNVIISGSYDYFDVNNDPEGTSLYKWYTATNASGANQTPITSSNASQITLDETVIGKYIGFGVTPIAISGISTGAEVVYYNPIPAKLSTPTATSVSFTGSSLTGLVGNTLVGNYNYSVSGSTGIEAGTIQKWYTANNATDEGTVVGTGATYTPTSNDLGKYIIYEVTPVTSTGVKGSTVRFTRNAGNHILDLTPQTVQAAYSLRKLRAAYTGFAIQVRRSSDNLTTDIGFNLSGSLDEDAVTSFVTNNGVNSTANGFVSIWYDQSGNGKNATNATASEQPRIVSSGVLEKYNGVPTVMFVKASNTKLLAGTSTSSPIYVSAAMGVFAHKATSNNLFLEWDGIVSDISGINGLNASGIIGQQSTTNLYPFGNNGVSAANFYKNKILRTLAGFDIAPITSLNVIYGEHNTNLSNQNQWQGIQLGNDRGSTNSSRNWDGPISEVILFEQNFKANNYVDVLNIQDAQMLYYLGK